MGAAAVGVGVGADESAGAAVAASVGGQASRGVIDYRDECCWGDKETSRDNFARSVWRLIVRR